MMAGCVERRVGAVDGQAPLVARGYRGAVEVSFCCWLHCSVILVNSTSLVFMLCLVLIELYEYAPGMCFLL